MASVHSLPDEVLLKIFSYLDVTDVALAVANVCSRWCAVAQDKFLWSDLNFTVFEETKLSSVVSLLPHLQELRLITLQWRTDSHELVTELSKQCPHIEAITLFCCGYVKENCLKQISESFKNMRNLSLEKCYCVEYKCLDYVCLLTELTSLNISHCPLTPEQFRMISTGCTKIVSINIDNVRGISGEDLVFFISPRKSQLLCLTVFGELLTDEVVQHVALCSQLRRLQISNCCNLTDCCFKSIIKLKNLHSLILKKFVNIPTKSIHNFFFKSHLNDNIVYLYLSTKQTGHIEGQATKEDFSVWVRNKVGIEDSKAVKRLKTTINQNCFLVLRRKGFNYFIIN